ncbi:endonuclease/exonuclease/phosphatase family protein [Draconibacterium halophilum]|uniref:Endonuclease/exonuclease/phosphatase family protein n=1 Tax=Draconibacterium halophilum TaxID=2706887 RepID=A0A6C0RH10_9BACT|nr:endonuclease/exonuclease/phosphatase family protein [Draconibacterium halophilum]QIA08823.1 endonuclease/exonuclease/phosphatase family protein [Draconibacterium halophilum]
MVSHPQPPDNGFTFNVSTEKRRLTYHFKKRGIPKKEKGKVLIATWNLTNFGQQKRTPHHLEIMAHILSKFDVIAVQEVADNLEQFDTLLNEMDGNYEAFFSDIAGNYERLGFIYDATKLKRRGLVAELAMRNSQRKHITIEVGDEKEEQEFSGFNRNPYMATFYADNFEFTLVNVHLYRSNKNIRLLETKAISNWARKRCEKPLSNVPSKDIMLLGDFNMPKLSEEDQYYSEITHNGLVAPLHETEYIGSNLAGDKNYDQLFFFPKHTNEDFNNGKIGVVDFDNCVFKDLWKSDKSHKKEYFFQYIRYYMADHRPLWAQFNY